MSDLYDGPAVVRMGEREHRVRVRLAGHLEPIDGRYHWRGMVFDKLADDVRLPQRIDLAVEDMCAEAQITERTPQGTYSVSGVGTPPFPRPTSDSPW